MRLAKFREEIVRYGRRMATAGLTTGTGGNLSCRDRPSGLAAVTPSGIDYDVLGPEDICVVDAEGTALEGKGVPSSETGFHLALYAARPDIGAVVHTHSPYATTLACLGWELPAVHYLVGFAGRKVRVAPYHTYGTPELARAVAEAIGGDNAVLLAHHGLVCVGEDLGRAFAVAEEIEFCARVYLTARSVGMPEVLPDEEMDRVIARFAAYGRGRAASS